MAKISDCLPAELRKSNMSGQPSCCEVEGNGVHSQQLLNVLGTQIGVINLLGAVNLLETWINSPQVGRYVCVTGVHGVMEGLRDPRVRTIHNRADAVMPDGMPLTWLGWCHGYRDMNRVYGPDLMLAMLEVSAQKGYTNYFYGGKGGVVDDLARRMSVRFPGLRVVGTYSPPFGPLSLAEEAFILSEINMVKPDFLWIGLSTPKQEIQMAGFSGKVQAKVMIGVGAAFDFHTGRVRQAPFWIQRAGLEWLFRLCMEPRRLAGRYLRNNPLFLFNVVLQMTGLRSYPVK